MVLSHALWGFLEAWTMFWRFSDSNGGLENTEDHRVAFEETHLVGIPAVARVRAT